MYYAGQLERKHNVRFRLVGAMENNTIPLGLASLWAGSGAKYSWKGIGGYGSQMTLESRASRRHQLYRYTGLDSSGVLMKWYNYDEKVRKTAPFGGYAECRLVIKQRDKLAEMRQIVAKLDAMCDTISPQSTYPYNVAGAFGYGWDDLDNFTSTPFLDAARLETTSTRRVRVSNEEDFFEDVARSYPNLPHESVSYGNEWDVYCASMNETTARVRRATEKLRSAEALASLVALKTPAFAESLAPARNLAWESFGMYWEHNWTADGPVKRPVRADWQNKIQGQITGYVDSLLVRSANGLGRLLKRAKNPRFYVFNPLNWVRSDVADLAYTGPYPIRVVDLASEKDAPAQLMTKDSVRYLRIWAEAIPSVGYKVFELRTTTDVAGTPARLPVAATVSATSGAGRIIRTARYRLRLSPSGAITELYDSLAGGRQVVKASNGRYVNDLGAGNVEEGSPVVVENEGPVSVTLRATSPVPMPHTVRVTLFAGSPDRPTDRIEIDNRIEANFGDVKTWAFSFNLNNPTTHHEELGAVLTAKRETRGGHYASQNARLDWQTFNHFADLSEAGYGVTLSNLDCSFFKLGQSTVDSLHETSAQLNALAGGQVDKKVEDGGMMGIFNQHGQTQFGYHFALTTHRGGFEPVAAMRFSLEHQNPLVTGMVTGDGDAYPSPTFSLLRNDDPKVLLWSVKPGEDGIGAGLITRFWNMAGQSATPTVTVANPIRRAWQTTHLETDGRALTPAGRQLRLRFAPHQLNTYRLQLTR